MEICQSVFTKYVLDGKTFTSNEEIKNHVDQQRTKILWALNYATSWKMAKGIRPESRIYNSIKYLITIIKLSYIFMKGYGYIWRLLKT